METNLEEALSIKAYAEKRFIERDYAGARNYALKAQMLCPELEGISQMVATFGVYTASEAKINGEFDFYAILGLNPSVEKAKLKKQYKKMAVLLHPDKNKTVGADGAFKLVSEAWTVLSDSNKRALYDNKRNYITTHTTGVSGYDNYSKSSTSHQRLDTFWTVCTSCHVQYEYLRKYVNKKLSCKNCRGVFVAVETGVAPVNGSFPYCPWSFVPDNGYTSHGCGVQYIPSATAYCSGNGISGHHSGHGSEYVSNISFQWASFTGNSSGVSDPNGISIFTDVAPQVNGQATVTVSNGKRHKKKNAMVDVPNGFSANTEPPATKVSRPYKKRKFDPGSTCSSGNMDFARASAEVRVSNANGGPKPNPKPVAPADTSVKRCSAAPAFDARQLLIDKARTVIRQKLKEIKLASEAAAAEAEKKKKAEAEQEKLALTPSKAVSGGLGHQAEPKRAGSLSITVPDSDFHDFDKDRSEECFKPKQVWALYDEEDGMPRLYCLIRQIISVKPFKVHISYLSSRTDTEFGAVNWLDSGFTKSCGNFRAFNAEIVEQVNIFSHLLSKEKAGRGGCIRIYPRSGDIWAVYRNWSSDWNRTTPAEVRHQYEMVEVLGDYSEDIGVCVAPLLKLEGFKTVYRRNDSKEAIRWIPRREMLRFSHQVPSCLLKGDTFNLPDGCWDLDPAATPDELLQLVQERQKEESLPQTGVEVGVSNDSCLPGSSSHGEPLDQINNFSVTLENGLKFDVDSLFN
ncbi:OLC1v1024636C1 [Oldenlandia corymbosa var. corymbosa]|uniref:OLC1v1024636C1 n=1 Tax=Oldenlandia corymbosa var. corymbosa TaxID=529605 RepID=A0AAV1C3R5_OLDCO|nr:OLC1v1024636C1 [Oldenlandia corymbosa var. corymbosa]